MKLTKKLKTAILKHAESEYPRECCGLIVGGNYIPCGNQSTLDSQFAISPQDYVAASEQGEQIVLDADLPKDPVYTFSRANVVDGDFSYTGTRARDRHTIAKVAWDNPEQKFKTEYEFVRDEAAIARYGVKVLDLSIVGCTSQGQAQRAGLWALKSEQLETRTVTFKTGLDGFIPTVGSIINVSDEVLAGRANGGRVSAVSANLSTITLDRDVTVSVGDTLIINADNGKAQRRIVSSVSGRNVTVSVAFGGVSSQNVWAVDSSDLKTMRFRVLSIKQDDVTFTITAIVVDGVKYKTISEAEEKTKYTRAQIRHNFA